MKVFFDHQAFSIQEYGGISRYFSELVSGINQRTQHEAYVSVRYSNNVHAHDQQLVSKYFFKNVSFPKKVPLLYRINKAFTYADLHQRSYDLIHSTYYDTFALSCSKRAPSVITFYDMIHERLRHKFTRLAADRTLMEQKRVWATRATRLIAISETTKRDMIELLNVSPEKIEVIYLSSSIQPRLTLSETLSNNQRPYLLFVGNRDYYKNFLNFLIAVAPLLHTYGLALVCAGGGPFKRQEHDLIASLRLIDQVEQQPIDDKSAPNLYARASLFVFPSLYEGFGIPLLEAFSCNCPCVVSNSGSLPEIGGDSAYYFDPTDIDSIRSAIGVVLDDSRLASELVKAGQKRLTFFSWQRTSNATSDLYESIL